MWQLCNTKLPFLLQSFVALFALAAIAAADRPAPYEPAPYKPAPYQPAYKPYQPAYKEPKYAEPANYEYNYAVKDEYAGVDFNANEAREGYATNGGYRVVLPDGRTQIVTYTVADDYSGYVADVQYEGEAKYDEYKPKYEPKYQPAYKPYQPKYEPAYKPTYSA